MYGYLREIFKGKVFIVSIKLILLIVAININIKLFTMKQNMIISKWYIWKIWQFFWIQITFFDIPIPVRWPHSYSSESYNSKSNYFILVAFYIKNRRIFIVVLKFMSLQLQTVNYATFSINIEFQLEKIWILKTAWREKDTSNLEILFFKRFLMCLYVNKCPITEWYKLPQHPHRL